MPDSYSDLFFLFLTMKGPLFVHLFNLNYAYPKHTGYVRTSSKTNQSPEPRKHTKDPPFDYLGVFNLDCFRHYETIFENFSIALKGLPFNFFDILQQNVC